MQTFLAWPLWQKILAVAAGLFVLLQLLFIPMLVKQTNPPVVQEPRWDSPQTKALAQRACYDCHSNETTWPLYGKIAPISWLVTRDVVEGREKLNFSDWMAAGGEAEEIAEEINEGKMPMAIYLPMHPDARLTAAEKQQLIKGLETTIAAMPGGGGGESHGSEEGEEEEHEGERH